MKKIAIIGAGKMASIIGKRSKELGIESHCFAWEKGAIAKNDVDYFHDISIFEKEKIVDICRELSINGVIATTELTIAVAAYIAKELNLNGNRVDISDVITDKFRNREATSNVEGLCHPRYMIARNVTDCISNNLKYPVIVKPLSEGGKRGISVAYSNVELEQAFKYAYMDGRKKDAILLVEEYISEGQEYSVESLSFHGIHYFIQITKKESSGFPHCVELAHHQPSGVSSEMCLKVKRILNEALSAIGIENGPCHTEIKIVDDKIYLIEFNARPGGDHIAYPLTELSTGYPYITGIIQAALDELEPIDFSAFKNNFAGIYFVTQQTAYLKNIFMSCQNYPWCYEKNEITTDLQELSHNNGADTNYFIYYTTDGNPISFNGEVVCDEENN